MIDRRKTILFDLDHTLVDATRRDHLIPAALASGEWDEYHSGSIDDGPAHDAIMLYRIFRAAGYTILGLTARPAKWQDVTMQWLDEANVSFDDLLMRPAGDYRHAAQMKIELVKQRFGEKIGEHILFIVDDHPEVCEAFAKEGVTSLQIHGRDYG